LFFENKNICEEIGLIDNILQAEDFIRLRIQAGSVEIPVEHARKYPVFFYL